MTIPRQPPPAALTPLRPDPHKIIVPRKHGQVLIEPPLTALIGALQNSTYGKDTGKPPGFDQSWFHLRFAARREFSGALTEHAKVCGLNLDGLPPAEHRWIFTGHQVEFYHAGVWAKVIALDELARRASAAGTPTHAFDLLVDHDTVDDLGFSVPDRDGDAWKKFPVEWAAVSTLPADSLDAPTPAQYEEWDSELARHPQAHADTMAFLLAALNPAQSKIENGGGRKSKIAYVPWLSHARRQLERALDIHVHHIPTGLLCRGVAWEKFVRAWIENADPWTAAYNRHLAAYRHRQGIQNDHHPMPNLARTTAGEVTTFELPFWIYKKGQPRQRLMIRKTAGKVTFLHDGAEHSADSGLRTQDSGVLIRPRALTLTMFVRLFLADLFIHGIGGALYDQITDGLIEELFHIAPPYACVSAAWLLPLGQPLESADDLAALQSLRHHLQHNPQLAIDPFTALKADVAEKIRDRRELIEKITASLATARHDKDAIRSRRESFHQLHTINAQLHALAPNILRNFDTQIADTLRAREQNKVLLWREYFFGLHSMDSLKQLIAKIRAT